jgi:two-component system, LytTR family, response regulator
MKNRKITVIHVDDMQTEIIRFKKTIEGFEDISLKASFSNSQEALDYCAVTPPDLAILDIEMPDKDGTWLASKLKEIDVPFAFLTSHENHGILAFKLQAIHYLPKPVTKNELAELFNRFRLLKNAIGTDNEIINVDTSKEIPKRIFVNTQKQILILQLENIVYLSAEGSYTKFHLADGKEVLSGKNMKTYQSIVEKNPDFIKIHRSYIINQSHLQSIDKKKMEMKFLFKNGSIIKMATFRRDEWLEKFL